MRLINEIIVHCTGNTATSKISLQDIRDFHIHKRGWRDIGYHFVIFADGRVEKGRPVQLSGAHCKGHNSHSIGIAYIGGILKDGTPADTRTFKQKNAIIKLIKELKQAYPSIVRVSGHRDYANKACPCFDAHAEYQRLV